MTSTQIRGSQIQDDTVTSEDIKDHTIKIIDLDPECLTKEAVGLSNVDNTSDINKIVSIPVQNALDLKQDKIPGIFNSLNPTLLVVPNVDLEIDSFLVSYSNVLNYIIQAKSENDFLTTQLMILHNGVDSTFDSFGELSIGENSLTFNTIIENDLVTLTCSAVLPNTEIKGIKSTLSLNQSVNLGALSFISTITLVEPDVQIEIDSADLMFSNSISYVIQAKSGNTFVTTRLSVLHNGEIATMDEFGTLTLGDNSLTFDVIIEFGTLILLCSASLANTEVRAFRVCII